MALAPACSDDGFARATMPSGTSGGVSATGNVLTTADRDDGIDPSLPTAPGSDDGTTAALDGTAGSGHESTGSSDDATVGHGTADAGPTADTDDSGVPSDEGDTGGTPRTLELVDAQGLPTFGDTGTPATSCIVLVAPANGYDTVVGVELEVAMTHAWIGDVTIEVVAPDGTRLTVLNRAGHPTSGSYGDDSDVAPANPLTFRDGPPVSAETMGSTLGAAVTICAADGVCDFYAAPDAGGTGGGVGTAFSDFAGVAADGQWQVCFTDHADQDPLTVAGATLRITKSM